MADTVSHREYFSPLTAFGIVTAAITMAGAVYLCELESQTSSERLNNAIRLLGSRAPIENVSETTQAMRD